MSLFWGIVLAGIGAYTMRASFVLLLSGVSFPDRVIRILDHVGPAVMAALVVDAPDKVDALHAAAMSLGGKNEGDPGPRGDSGFYAGYFRDLDGNKLAAYCIVPKN